MSADDTRAHARVSTHTCCSMSALLTTGGPLTALNIPRAVHCVRSTNHYILFSP